MNAWTGLLSACDTLGQTGPIRLIGPDAPGSPNPWYTAAIACASLSAILLALSLATFIVWRRDRRHSATPQSRAWTGLASAWSLSSAQRRTVQRLAADLGPHDPPSALLLSRTALRRAVAKTLERKPEPAELRDIQRLVEKLVGDLPDDRAGGDAPDQQRSAPGRVPSRAA